MLLRRHTLPTSPPSSTPEQCELCKGQRFQLIAECDRRRRALETVLCRQCGLVSHARIPSDHELQRYYQQQYRRDYHGEYAPSAYRVTREWERCGQFVRRLRPLLRATDHVVEIGSGIGCTVKHLELAGYHAEGIEPGDGFCRFSQETLRATVTRCWLSEMPRSPAYDVVILAHVLEHLNSPKKALRHIWQMLRRGGRLYVEVPNFGAPQSAPGKIFHAAHIYNFTPATLRMMGNAAGFEVAQLTNPRNKNLAVLMRKRDTVPAEMVPAEIEPSSYQCSLNALRRYTTLTYHLRWSYLTDSATRLASRIRCHFRTQQKYEAILRSINDRPPLAQQKALPQVA